MTNGTDVKRLSDEELAEIAADLKAADGWPWKYEQRGQMVTGHSVGGCSLTPSDYRVADVRGWGHLQYLGVERGDGKAQALQDANGKLIAKAPEHIAALLSHIAALTANRGSVSEDRAWEIYIRACKAEGLLGVASFLQSGHATLEHKVAIATIQQAVSECSGGGAEEMREAAARLAEERFVVWGRDKTGMVAAEAVASVCENIARAIRALPLPPSPVKESRDAVIEECARYFKSQIHNGQTREEQGILRDIVLQLRALKSTHQVGEGK